MVKSLYELIEDLTEKDYVKLIKRRIPVCNEEIKIVKQGLKVVSDAFIDVPFYFELGLKFPEVLYTHFYHSELLEYIDKE